jgi:hypothetical protein
LEIVVNLGHPQAPALLELDARRLRDRIPKIDFRDLPVVRNLKMAAVALFGAVTTACVSTQELPLAPNVVQLDTHASGALFTGQATAQTMKRAAELTLQNGYTHFRLENAQMSQGSQLAAVYSTESGNTLATGYGGATFATGSASGLSTPIYKRTADVAVTVVMFHADEPEAKDAFDAGAVLKRYGG